MALLFRTSQNLAFCLLLLISIQGLSQQYTFEKITDRSGRSLGFTSGVLQGNSDYLWIATSKGLIQYNGYSHKRFRHSPNNPSSIKSSTVSGIFQDSKGRMWLKHLDYFSIFNAAEQDSLFSSISNLTFEINATVAEDAQGNIWIGPHKNGMLKIDSLGRNIWYSHKPAQYSSEARELIASYVQKAEWKIDREKLRSDTSFSFYVTEDTYALVIGAGEFFNGEFFDYSALEYQGTEQWRIEEESARVIGKSTVIQASVISLKPGAHTLRCVADDSDMEEKLSAAQILPASGIFLAKIPADSVGLISEMLAQESKQPYSLHSENIIGMFINQAGRTCIVSPEGIEVFNTETQSFEHTGIPFRTLLSFSKIDHAVVAPAPHNAIYIGTNAGLLRYSFKTGSADTVFTQKNKRFPGSIYSLCTEGDNLWIGTNKGLHLYDSRQRSLLALQANTQNNLWGNTIFNIYRDKSENIWVSTSKGLNKLRKYNFKHLPISISQYSEFPYIQEDGSIVFHAYRNFLCRYNIEYQTESFISLPEDIFPYNSYFEETDYSVSCMAQNGYAKNFIGIGNKIVKTDGRYFTIAETYELRGIAYGKDSLKNQCKQIHIDAAERAWVVSADGVELFGSFRKFKLGKQYKKGRPVDFKYVVSSFSDRAHNIWIRTKDSILVFSTEEKAFSNRWIIPEGDDKEFAYKGNFGEDADGNIWCAAMPYVFKYSADDNKLSRHKLSCNTDIGKSSVYPGNGKYIWIYTDNGLLKLNSESFEYQLFSIDHGLADNNITGVVQDKYGKVWVTTLKGLSVMQTEDNSCESFFLPSDNPRYNFSGNNVLAQADSLSTLLLFTNKGYLRVDPGMINAREPRLSIERFSIKGTDWPLDTLRQLGYRLDLPHNQNFIAIEFSALDFTNPAKNKFEYQLSGLETDWQQRDASSRTAVYTGLAPGEYTFKLRACNNDYIWSSAPLELHITINPPWWHTWGAYISYVLIIVLSLFGYIKARERQLREEKLVLEQKVTERTYELQQKQKEITKQRDEIAEHQKSIMDSIHYASRIQQAVLPPADLTSKILPEHFILSKPRDIVSGDYYWVYGTEKQTVFAAADCTGHGVPGAFMSMLGVAFLNEIAGGTGEFSAKEVLNKLRNHVIRSLHQTGKIGEAKDGMDIALCVLDNATNVLQFSGAYNPLYLVRGGELSQLKADRMPIGYHNRLDSFSNAELQLEDGDCLYIFSDGYADQFGGEKGKKFMAKRFKQLLLDVNPLSMQDQKEKLNETIEAWRGDHEQVDDILVIGIRAESHSRR